MTRWRWAALAGVATAAALAGFGALPSDAGCRALTAQPWANFQQSGSVARAAELIAACGTSLRTGMAYDALLFIPAFSAFLALTLWALRPAQALALAGGMLIPAGALADQAEGLRLLVMIESGPTPAAVAGAAQATWLKILLLSLATGVVGMALARIDGWRRFAGFAVVGAAAVASVVGSAALGIAWLALLFVALAGALRRDPADD